MIEVIKWHTILRLNTIIIVFLVVLFGFSTAQASLLHLESTQNKGICQEELQRNAFSWADYLVLATMLIISCGIGVFYGCFNKSQNSDDFLLGGSTMGTFPMAMSLAASFITAIELLGNPAELYTHGLQFWMICISFILVVPLTSAFYLPVFLNLRLTSSYEYLSLRFSPSIRYLASGLYILQMILYTSVAVYAPALALSKVTKINVYLAVTAVYVVCIFYASQGGMKAVIIADTFQAAVLIGSLLLIAGLGYIAVGGTGAIWSHNYVTDRLEIFNFDPDMTVRHSFWSVVVGGTFYWMTMFCSNQASIQKYLSVESISQVRKAIWTSAIGLVLIYSINFYTGMIMVTHYKDCDPLTSKQISASDEILPYYIINEMGHMKGLTGFFVAGIFAASLGTVASALNSLAAVTIEDFIEAAFKKKIPAKKGAFIAKSLSILYGALSFALVFVVANSGSVMQVAISFNGMVGGVTFGLFSLGMLFPWANSKGALFGSVIATVLITFMCIGQQVAIASGNLEEQMKPMGTNNCSCITMTREAPEDIVSNKDSVFVLYRVSYIWYSGIGCVITIVLGLVISFITGTTNLSDVENVYISPPILKFLYWLPDNIKQFLGVPHKSINFMRNNFVKEAVMVKINEEEFHEVKQNNFNEQIKKKIRKLSAPS
ncbi:unnamed protein product [Psylliodes chrysocephalus]|uniref:Sodium-coupled monocarboxylate transporter 1 n=1 Tax=Psylliodes chrysocephalus TaxID=3402493 RepID=A0A9P0GHD5_9CUCU|nr:unnamed protein product [Psylliodes chrysocephala]